MADTTNKLFEKPAYNDYSGNPTGWTDPINTNWDEIDTAFGGVANINVTSVSGTVALTPAQYRPLTIKFSGTLTANVNYQIPSGTGGQWIIVNGTTGSFDLTISSAGGGSSVTVLQGESMNVYSDGTNVERTIPDNPIEDNSITNAKLAQIDTQRLKGRSTAGTGNVEDITISAALDFLATTRGAMPFRGASAWTSLAASTSGYILKTNGATTDPSWMNPQDIFPSQSGNSRKMLTTDGTSVSWSSNVITARAVVTNGLSATCTISGDQNVSGVTQAGGTYTVSFTSNLDVVDYQAIIIKTASGVNPDTIPTNVNKTVSGFTFTYVRAGTGGAQAVSGFDFVVVGGLT